MLCGFAFNRLFTPEIALSDFDSPARWKILQIYTSQTLKADEARHPSAQQYYFIRLVSNFGKRSY